MTGYFKTIEDPDGLIQFSGSVRCWDDAGRDAFEIQLSDKPLLYGEWKPEFSTSDRNVFGVQIVRFGFLSKRDLGIPHEEARLKLGLEEAAKVQRLVLKMFSDEEATSKNAPFATSKAIYTGRVEFSGNWIVS